MSEGRFVMCASNFMDVRMHEMADTKLVRVKVWPDAGEELLKEGKKGGLEVFVREPPLDNRANKRVCMLVARHFKVPVTFVRIVSGHHARGKILSVRQ